MNDALDHPPNNGDQDLDDHARGQTHARYRTYLAEVLGRSGVGDPIMVADVALNALTQWRDINTGGLCRCSCHPQLPDHARHDFGFDCYCTRPPDQQRDAFRQVLNELDEYWQTPAGLQSRAATAAAEQELHAWLDQHPGVSVHSHGGCAPEQWEGEVDGHTFYYRERGGDWDLEIDLRPTGQFVRVVDGRNDDGTARYRQQATEQGDTIATGTFDAADYATTPAQRAEFIVATIRDYLTRKSCTHHVDKLGSIREVIGTSVQWCPTCGARLPGR
ncbi:hypothetical protein [Mycobacterium sp. 29Ha]|uniref:hypothetical protein n=1 Tax=Mycobacterium sp. 29Ha TaxID=2939268 RepID=UPI00293951B4|nr:hypothetical protein [Mycobacterium sp. 29Ha]MDV3131453.1 hypothetical protein [Mycobacterium sp. 29Ha]